MGDGNSGINISGITGSNINIQGDLGVNIVKDNVGNVAVGAGAQASGSVSQQQGADLAELLAAWKSDMFKKVDDLKGYDDEEKAEIKTTVEKIETEVKKVEEAAKTEGATPETGKLERLMNTLGSMAPDIVEVAFATLSNPLAGLGLVVKKVNEKIALEKAAASEKSA